ncbi:MAG TPA: hypothetical protein ACQGQI_01185 [Xylella sp.]
MNGGGDIVVGNSQRFGVPFGFGGLHAAFMACRDAYYKRLIPGRLIGVLVRIARRIHRMAAILAVALRGAGLTVGACFFDTLHIIGIDAVAIYRAAEAAGINLRVIDSAQVGVSLDETVTRADLVALGHVFGVQVDVDALDVVVQEVLPTALLRTSAFLTHPVFNTYHSEHELLCYLRTLADKDLAMDRTMIPLGSCTMKLNATAEMIPVTWPEFACIHPLAPAAQWSGYRQLIDELEAMLVECTGYDAVSVQPNSDAQGEYAGLLTIRAYHRARGEECRNICLIPESAHGTSPASAQMCGMKVVIVRCDKNGNVDVDDLQMKAEKYSDSLAALMITYPSTHGVFEEAIMEICEIVRTHGGRCTRTVPT